MAFNLDQSVRSKEHQNLSGKLRPSGRFSFAQIFPSKKKVLNDDKTLTSEKLELLLMREEEKSGGLSSSEREEYLSKLLDRSKGSGPNLGSSTAVNSNIRAARGSSGITASQRDVLCWAANSLEHRYGRRRMSFLTYTLPPLSGVDLASVQKNWSSIVNYVVIEIKRELERRGIRTHVVGCSELQMERLEETGCAYPHLHLVFQGRRSNRSHWAIKPGRFRDIWRRSVSRYLFDKGVSWSASENIQQVRSSAGGYLAKYISKGASKHVVGSLASWHPSDWIICSRRLRTLYNKMTYQGYEVAQWLQSLVKEWSPGMGFKRDVVISSAAYGERKIGEWGWLSGACRYPDKLELDFTDNGGRK